MRLEREHEPRTYIPVPLHQPSHDPSKTLPAPPRPQERQWRVKYAFERYTYWNLETPPTKNDNMLSWRDAVSLAERVGGACPHVCLYYFFNFRTRPIQTRV